MDLEGCFKRSKEKENREKVRQESKKKMCCGTGAESMESRLILDSLNVLNCSVIKLAKFTHPLISGVTNFM